MSRKVCSKRSVRAGRSVVHEGPVVIERAPLGGGVLTNADADWVVAGDAVRGAYRHRRLRPAGLCLLLHDHCRGITHLVVHSIHSAWVGDMRAARRAGSSPATAPIRTAAPIP